MTLYGDQLMRPGLKLGTVPDQGLKEWQHMLDVLGSHSGKKKPRLHFHRIV